MYVPSAFRVDDHEWAVEFLREFPFATLVTMADGAPYASHLPILFLPDGNQGTLVGHMARANPQWQHFDDDPVLSIFHGPHAYVSPSWYQTQPAVPTWNYAAAHVYGVPRILTDPMRVHDLLQLMTETFEGARPDAWDGRLPEELYRSLAQAIVAFEIPIERIEAKQKLGQNRSVADRRGAADQLSRQGEDGRLLARWMHRQLESAGEADR